MAPSSSSRLRRRPPPSAPPPRTSTPTATATSTATAALLAPLASLILLLTVATTSSVGTAEAFRPPSTSTSTSTSRPLPSSGATATTTAATAMRASPDEEIASWVKEAGYGSVTSSKSSGSSGWASFRRVEVSDPPSPGTSFFVKTSTRSSGDMFEGEGLGLRAMFECSRAGAGDGKNGRGGRDALRIPEVYHWGDYANGGGSFLVMEYLNLGGRSDDGALGRAMARMHLADPTQLPSAGNPDGKFGFNVDNTIGGTSQPNGWTDGGTTDDWVGFFRDKRIGHQLDLAGDSYLSNLWHNDIAPRLGGLFEGLAVRPSMLHGDLWSGNIGSADGSATIYDPACYWGHHEAEWGMSWCASFGKSFWDGYRSLIPEDEGFLDRKPLYDAYHQLNHYNLFGGGYLGSARRQLEIVKRKLDERGA